MAAPIQPPELREDPQSSSTISRKPIRAAILPDAALAALRVVSAFMFIQHGVQKWFGLLLAPDQAFQGAPSLFSPMGIAGTLEVGGGLLLLFGLFTRPVAFVLSGMMAVAYFTVHAPQGFWPILNRGELAALYCFVFLAFAALGGGRFSLDNVLRHRPRLILVQ